VNEVFATTRVERSFTIIDESRTVLSQTFTPQVTRQGAQHAVAAFLSGYLNVDMRVAFSRLGQRVILVWGKQDTTTPIAKATALLDLNPRAELEVFDFCRVMPGTRTSGTIQCPGDGCVCAERESEEVG
jgi:pimeloyl-ACP methyl ester carboxylesterase